MEKNFGKVSNALKELERVINNETTCDFVRKRGIGVARRTFDNYMFKSTACDIGNDQIFEMTDIDEDTNITSTDIINRATDVIKVFYNLNKKLSQVAFDFCGNAAVYFDVLSKKFNLTPSRGKLDGKTERAFTKNYRDSYIELMQIAKDVLTESNFLDSLIVREAKSYRDIGLTSVFTQEFLEAKKDEMINPNMVNFSNDVESTIVGAFWLNKITKLLEDCKIGYIAERTNQDVKLGRLKDKDEDTIFAIADKRYALLNQILRYMSKQFLNNDEFRNFSISEYCMYRYYCKDRNDDPSLKELFENTSPEKVVLYEKAEVKRFTNYLKGVEQKYNTMLNPEASPDSFTFLNDLLTLAVIHDCKSEFYDAKTEMASIAMLTLAMSKRSHQITSPSRRWGIVRDAKYDEDERVNKILVIDLLGYLKPISVHIENELYEVFKKFGDVDEYVGDFAKGERSLTTAYGVNVVYKLNEQDKSKLKKHVTERKNKIIKEKNMISRQTNMDPMQRNLIMKGIICNMDSYKILREMVAVATGEYTKWLDPDKLLDAPIGE